MTGSGATPTGAGDSPARPRRPEDLEPRFRISATLLVGVVLVAAAGSAGIAYAIGNRLASAGGEAAAGSLVAASTALLGVLILRPSLERPASDWMTSWLAATVVRLLLTPLLALSLYSALSLPGKPFLLAVAGTYLVCLFAETAVLARAVGSALSATLPEAASRRGNHLPPGDRS